MSAANVLVKIDYDYNYVKFQDSQNVIDIKPFQNELEKSRNRQLENIITCVATISKTLETLKSDVFKMTNKKIEVENLRGKLLRLEEKINQTKGSIRQELFNVLDDQEILSKDLKHLEKRMEDWSKPLSTHLFKPIKPSPPRKMNNSQLNDPTSEFHKFVSDSGGHYGGWLEQDHLLFIRERKKNRGKDKFLASVHSFLSDLTYEEIEEHENWYVKYESLRAAQKEAIQRWKEQRTLNDQQSKLKKDESDERKEPKGNSKRAKYQVDIAERIKEWKKKQQAKKLEEIERQVQEKKQLQQEREKMNRINQLKKLAISQYKSEKLNKIKAELLQEQNEKKFSAVDRAKKSILLKSFRLQDIQFIEKKKSIRLQMESKGANKFECLKLAKNSLDFLIQRDPQRIFKPTLIWTQHCQPNEDKEKINLFNLNTIPRLAIPEWRRGLVFN